MTLPAAPSTWSRSGALAPRYAAIHAQASALAAKAAAYSHHTEAGPPPNQTALRDLRSSGLAKLTVPLGYGGRFRTVDPMAICIVREVLMPASSHLEALFAMQGIGSFPITFAGTEDQKSRWLPKVAGMRALAALALTEPDAGSDLRSITTSMTAVGDTLHLSGEKSFISNAPIAGFYTTLAREGAGLSMILVPADAEGLTASAGPELSASHVIGSVRFDNLALPSSARLGQPGQGMQVALATLAIFRASVGAAAVGLAQRALEEAVRHTRTRHQFGRPLAKHGAVASMLADSWAEVEMARLLVYHAAALARDSPAEALTLSSLAKLAATEAAGRVVDRCVQVMGRFGLIRDSVIERLYRDARPMRIYEGASEVLRMNLARALSEQVP